MFIYHPSRFPHGHSPARDSSLGRRSIRQLSANLPAAWAATLLLAAAPAPSATPGAESGPLAAAEAALADLNDANGALGAIDSGLFAAYLGKPRDAWEGAARDARDRLARELGRVRADALSTVDRSVLTVLRTRLEADSATSSTGVPEEAARCAQASGETSTAQLSAALVACFTEFADGLTFEGERLDRATALARLHRIEEPARRKALFEAFMPLWRNVNGNNGRDSPYRRLIALTARESTAAGPLEAAARTVGASAAEVERWLLQILETWRDATRGERFEPWDYRYATGQADRAVSKHIPHEALLRIDHRYYRDLGADLDALGVVYDLEPRAGKSSVAYTDFLTRGRWEGRWQPTIARVLATYRDGGLGSLNELVHENGHAVHISAIRNRPAFVDWNDDLFVEAFADVPSWSVYEPEWQRRYLGASAPQSDSMRTLFGSVMLDVAWALFESRMLRDPTLDPNAVWTQITNRYLHVEPHPELAWWAVRVQLVELPGYMVNYGLGAVLTAELRQRTRAAIGPFHAGNVRWYTWLSAELLRFGSERDTAALIQGFLGRPVAPDALLAQLRRAAR